MLTRDKRRNMCKILALSGKHVEYFYEMRRQLFRMKSLKRLWRSTLWLFHDYYSFLLEWNLGLQFYFASKSKLIFHFESAMCAHACERVRSFSCSTWENYSYQSGIKEGSKTCLLPSYWEICFFKYWRILK